MQTLFNLEELLHLPFQHLGNGDSGPLGNDLGNILFAHFLLEHPVVLLDASQFCVFPSSLFGSMEFFRSGPRSGGQIAGTLCFLLAGLQVFQFLFGFANRRNDLFFLLPMGAKAFCLVPGGPRFLFQVSSSRHSPRHFPLLVPVAGLPG